MKGPVATSPPTSASATTGPGPVAGEPPRELLQHLTTLHAGLKKLLDLAQEKLTALRQADRDALQACAEREGEILQEIFQHEPQRKAVLARLAQGLHKTGPPVPRLTDIILRLPEPLASSLRARGTALRATAEELQRKNQLAAAVAHNLHSHIRGIFAELAGAAQELPVYGPQGQQEHSTPRCWIDAVG